MAPQQSNLAENAGVGDTSTTSSCFGFAGCGDGCFGGGFASPLRKGSVVPNSNRATSTEVPAAILDTLNNLSLKEREQVYDDIHGIVDRGLLAREEDTAFVENGLQAFQLELSKQTRSGRTAIEMAVTRRNAGYGLENYVQFNQDQCLMFLRADEWKAKLAAARLVRFYEEKVEMFGVEKLNKTILLEKDLTHQDQACLAAGWIQPVPLPDKSGRRILVFLPQLLQNDFTPENFRRVSYYVLISMVEEGGVDFQQKGIIEIGDSLGVEKATNKYASDFGVVWGLQRIRHAIPIRSAANHQCTNDSSIKILVNALRPLLTEQQLSRIRIHTGGYLENQYEMLSCGIPIEALPIDSNGVCRRDYLLAWIEKRRKMEEHLNDTPKLENTNNGDTSSRNNNHPNRVLSPAAEGGTEESSSLIVWEPKTTDCILGRGKAIDNHPGNKQFRKVCEQYFEQYESVQKWQKKDIALRLMDTLQTNHGMRFLEPRTSSSGDNGGWEEARQRKVLEKIARTMRRLR